MTFRPVNHTKCKYWWKTDRLSLRIVDDGSNVTVESFCPVCKETITLPNNWLVVSDEPE